MLVNILAQLVHNPDRATATHIKNFIDIPQKYDKPVLVDALRIALLDYSEVVPDWGPLEGEEAS